MLQRTPRKCSQCRQEGCNKSKAICPVNIARGYTPRQLLPVAGTCELCRREGCFTECPVQNAHRPSYRYCQWDTRYTVYL